MIRQRPGVCYSALFFSFCLLVPENAFCVSAQALALQSISTSDLADNPKTNFAANDFIRYSVSLSVPLVAVVFVRGSISFQGADRENLGLQFKTFQKGSRRIFWDSVVPANASGQATVTVYYLSIPGGFAQQSVSFTVSSDGGPPPGEAAYIGSTACIACHAGTNKDIVDAYQESGHHFALHKISGTPPLYPSFCPGAPDSPSGFAWSDIFYVIGGYGWKANFVHADGHFLTTGVDKTDAQYNLANTILGTPAEFVAYAPGQTEAKAFDCGPCHTTGYNAEGSQDNLTQIVGTWSEEGVGCEACHGPGSTHQANPAGVKPALDPKTSCAACHVRDNTGVIEADAGLLLQNQQTEELKAGAKSFFTCDSCHNAHASSRYDEQAQGTAIIKQCTSCHSDKTIGLGMQSLKCIDCHMPYAVQSGAHITFTDAAGNTTAQGDMRSHLFKVNAAAQSPAEMFAADGKSLAVDSSGKSPGLTLDLVCLGCHRPGGRAATTYTFEQVKGFAGSVH